VLPSFRCTSRMGEIGKPIDRRVVLTCADKSGQLYAEAYVG